MDKETDWHSDLLATSTKIDSAYKNTQNVRRFFKQHLGEDFKFDRDFMAWMKAAKGKALAEAIREWKRRNGGVGD